jgi:hypothetical protein
LGRQQVQELLSASFEILEVGASPFSERHGAKSTGDGGPGGAAVTDKDRAAVSDV